MVAFISPKWRQLLEFNRLLSFADIWKYRADWFEEPNNCRGGWSGVCQLELSDQAGNQLRVFLKRQENHVRRTWRHPLRGEPTFLREFEMLRYLQSCNVAMPAPVFFDSEMVEGKSRAILITEELVGYRPLDTVTEELFAQQRPAIATQRAIVRATASTPYASCMMPASITARSTPNICLCAFRNKVIRMLPSSIWKNPA